MAITNFTIHLDNNKFYSGQVVSGRVVLNMKSAKKIRGVQIKFRGKAKVHWNETVRYRDSNGKSHSRTIRYSAEEVYFSKEYNLVGKGDEFELGSGEHVYNFSNPLPASIPSTYHGEYGSVRYTIKAKMDIPWAIDEKAKMDIPVINLLNLNYNPQLKQSATNESDKTFCCWCCVNGPLTLKAYIPQTGFTFGQDIPLTVEINNSSRLRILKVIAGLVQKIKWTARSPNDKTRTSMNHLINIDFGDVSVRSTRCWNETLKVPDAPLVYLGHCDIIDISYWLKVSAEPEGIHSDLDVEIPIELGDIPLSEDEVTAPGAIPNYPNQGQFNGTTIQPYGTGQPPYQHGTPQPSYSDPQSQYHNETQPPYSQQPPYPGSHISYPGFQQPPYPGPQQHPYSESQQPSYSGLQLTQSCQPPYPGSLSSSEFSQNNYPCATQTSGSFQSPYPGSYQTPCPGSSQSANFDNSTACTLNSSQPRDSNANQFTHPYTTQFGHPNDSQSVPLTNLSRPAIFDESSSIESQRANVEKLAKLQADNSSHEQLQDTSSSDKPEYQPSTDSTSPSAPPAE